VNKGQQFWRRLEALGHAIFYVFLFLGGQTAAYLLLGPVTFVYVLISRRVHGLTRAYRRHRFPEHRGVKAWLDTYRIVYSFGQVLIDRAWLGIRKNAKLDGELIGREQLLATAAEGKGLVLLTAHVGNWQTALSHICDFTVPVNSLMHYEQEAVAKHYFDLRREQTPFRIISTEGFMGGLVEATAALGRGEVVTIMGDRYVKGPFVAVDFLGSPVRLPAAAYSLAAATGAPIAVLLAAKTGRTSYNLKLWDIFVPASGDRHERQRNLAVGAARFAGALAECVEQQPYQWYNFFDFWKQ
jgi:predicted LPLAT superfamily acyltransferase